MQHLDLTLDRAEANLALDEALLEDAEAGLAGECLRTWEMPRLAVVVGRSTRVHAEVDVQLCQRRGIPILRRCSGGTSVVVGPGCLLYSVVLSYDKHPQLRHLDEAHRFVMDRLKSAASRFAAVEVAGICDLAIDGRKCSGNSLRCKRNCLLYHGTLLYDFSPAVIQELLGEPARQPDYRQGRSHTEFLTSLPATANELRSALRCAWDVSEPRTSWPSPRVDQLIADRYSDPGWHFRL